MFSKFSIKHSNISHVKRLIQHPGFGPVLAPIFFKGEVRYESQAVSDIFLKTNVYLDEVSAS